MLIIKYFPPKTAFQGSENLSVQNNVKRKSFFYCVRLRLPAEDLRMNYDGWGAKALSVKCTPDCSMLI